jgi:hypothetical protein
MPYLKSWQARRNRFAGEYGIVLYSLIAAAAGLAFAFKIALALNTYGTNDVLFWEGDLAKIRADGGLALYRDGAQIFVRGVLVRTEPFNQPPFMIHIRSLAGAVAHRSGLPLGFWVRFASSLADIGSLALIWKILTDSGLSVRPVALLLVAISPVSIMVSGFHGNTDPVMMFFVLLSLSLIESGCPTWLAGAALGMAMNIKIVPIIFIPVFLLYLPGIRRWISFTLAAGMILTAGSLPYLVQDPLLIMHRVFGYNSVSAVWGISQIIYLFLPQGPFAAYRAVGKVLVFSIILLASFGMNRGNPKPALFLQCGCIAFLFLFWTPGFGVQYLAWLVPWAAALAGRRIVFFYIASGIYLFGFYTLWSRGFPWFLANLMDNHVPLWAKAFVFSLDTVCWISIGVIAFAYCRSIVFQNSGTTAQPFRPPISTMAEGLQA